EAVVPKRFRVIDFVGRTPGAVIDVDEVPIMGGWGYRKGRWNPWSRDGRRLTFIRRGQVWTSNPDGSDAKQLTFDSSNKAFPTFSPDGDRIGYITFQFDNRQHYTKLGPTDLWVVDCPSGLAVRLTRPDSGRIEDVDWLDASTLIYDRLGPSEHDSTLRTIS